MSKFEVVMLELIKLRDFHGYRRWNISFLKQSIDKFRTGTKRKLVLISVWSDRATEL